MEGTLNNSKSFAIAKLSAGGRYISDGVATRLFRILTIGPPPLDVNVSVLAPCDMVTDQAVMSLFARLPITPSVVIVPLTVKPLWFAGMSRMLYVMELADACPIIPSH